MVRIINYKERDKEDGTSFFVLELQGGIEMVKSKETGNFYATAKTTFIPSTFDEDVCAGLIGKEMPGRIIKEDCEPFVYVVKETGEQITLSHRWVYFTEDAVKTKQDTNLLSMVLKNQNQTNAYGENLRTKPEWAERFKKSLGMGN